MRFYKVLTVLVSLIIIVSPTYGQIDSKAERILKESQNQFRSLKDISANLSYMRDNRNLEEPIIKRGTVKLSGTKYVVKFAEEELYCDGKTTWVYVAREVEVTIREYDPEEDMGIQSLYQLYGQDTKSRYDSDEGSSHKVSIHMTDTKSNTWKVEFWISKSTKLISRATMYTRDGSTHTYQMSGMKMNSGLDSKIFTFDLNLYPGTYIRDYR